MCDQKIFRLDVPVHQPFKVQVPEHTHTQRCHTHTYARTGQEIISSMIGDDKGMLQTIRFAKRGENEEEASVGTGCVHSLPRPRFLCAETETVGGAFVNDSKPTRQIGVAN